MSEERVEHDEKTKITRVFRKFSSPKTLVPKEELAKWGKVARAGEDEEGRKVKEVRYVFSERETAEYNHQPLSFSGLKTYVKDGSGEAPFGDDPGFSAREDFGIEPK